MGHPLGATGAMILGTVLDELERSGKVDRAGDALHRRRHGHRDHHRAGLVSPGAAMPKIDIAKIAFEAGRRLSGPFKTVLDRREKKRLGNAVGLDQFGVNLTRSSRRRVVAAPLARERGRVRLRARRRGRADRGRRRDRAQARRRRRLEGRFAERPQLGQPRQQATRSSSKSARVRNRARRTIRTSILILERDAQGRRYLHKNGEPY